MPELPEVETVRRGLSPVLEGRRIIRVQQRRPDLRFLLPAGFARAIAGRRVEQVDRRAKYLLVHLSAEPAGKRLQTARDGSGRGGSGALVLLAHLGMSGRFRVFAGAPPPLQPHDHIIFETDDGVTIRFHDPRRFGFMDLCRRSELDRHPMLARLGPEPLGEAFTADYLAARLLGRITSIKAAILDQGVVAGLGNIYACESLHRAGLSPRRLAGSIAGRRAERLVDAIRSVLSEAIAAGGSSLRDHRRPSGELGTFQLGFAVYGKEGQPCPGCVCDITRTGGIRRFVQAGRSTFHCARRQR